MLWTAAWNWKATTPHCVMCTWWVSATVCWVIHVCVLASLCVVHGTSVTVLCKAAWMSATPPRYSPTFLTAVIIGALNFLCCRPVVWLRYCCLYKFWNTLATINFKIMSVPPVHWHSCSIHLFLSPKFKLSSGHNYTSSNFCPVSAANMLKYPF